MGGSDTGTIDRAALVGAARDLEPLPPSALRLAALLSDPDWDSDQVARAIRFDPPLAAKLLRVANSPALGARQRIGAVEAAIVRLGPGSVLALALGSPLGRALKDLPEGYDGSPSELWSHAVAASLAAEGLRRKCSTPLPHEAGTAGLLHDIGKLVLARAATSAQKGAIEFAVRERGLELHHAETEQLGIHHAELGGAVAREWGLPDAIATAITYHHEPDATPEVALNPLVAAVRLADLAANASLRPPGERELPVTDRVGSAQVLGFPASAFATLCAEVRESVHELAALYGV